MCADGGYFVIAFDFDFMFFLSFFSAFEWKWKRKSVGEWEREKYDDKLHEEENSEYNNNKISKTKFA